MPPAPQYFPYGIYAMPEISTVGMSEEEVRAAGIPCECGIARFRETSRGHIMGLNAGMMKMIFALDTRRLRATRRQIGFVTADTQLFKQRTAAGNIAHDDLIAMATKAGYTSIASHRSDEGFTVLLG